MNYEQCSYDNIPVCLLVVCFFLTLTEIVLKRSMGLKFTYILILET